MSPEPIHTTIEARAAMSSHSTCTSRFLLPATDKPSPYNANLSRYYALLDTYQSRRSALESMYIDTLPDDVWMSLLQDRERGKRREDLEVKVESSGEEKVKSRSHPECSGSNASARAHRQRGSILERKGDKDCADRREMLSLENTMRELVEEFESLVSRTLTRNLEEQRKIMVRMERVVNMSDGMGM